MNFHILTLFPEMVMQGLSTSIIGKAKENGLISIEAINIRDYTLDKHKKVDDYPYGGGAGMLMQAQPVYDAWKSVADKVGHKPRTVYLTPQGQTFSQPMAKELALEEDLVLLCGHYEGIDERVLEEIVTDYMSIGDYVLTGGELPAMVMVDAISRMVPGVLTNEESGSTESFEGNLLEYPQYSRPEVWMGKAVPEVLLSGNQKNIRTWRKEAAIVRTKERRPDMYAKYEALDKCREILKKQKLHHMDMTELIARGQAELVYVSGETICLYDTVSGIYFHTTDDAANGRVGLEKIKEYAVARGGGDTIECMALHQEYMCDVAAELLGMSPFLVCNQAVYTRKEKLPITGLYSVNGKNTEELLEIRKLSMEHFDVAAAHYEGPDGTDYIREHIEKGSLYGAFLQGELTGYIGRHEEGGIGILQVFPEYRRRKIGKALETYMINLSLDMGHTPYGQVVEGNEKSMALQESLGLCFAKGKIYWMEK
ncbi:MAG: tRNA (guanosine(37)-N1)-methyltransferase TrmD [Roseburia sp.]|nr:tRNA (guanosine(37)-N1)-methyltransferase TrmD [Roseburia sp.]